MCKYKIVSVCQYPYICQQMDTCVHVCDYNAAELHHPIWIATSNMCLFKLNKIKFKKFRYSDLVDWGWMLRFYSFNKLSHGPDFELARQLSYTCQSRLLKKVEYGKEVHISYFIHKMWWWTKIKNMLPSLAMLREMSFTCKIMDFETEVTDSE